MEGITVTTEKQYGEKSTGVPGVTRQVYCGQHRVFVNGEFFGYAPDEGQVSIVKQGIDEDVLAYIKSEVDRLRGKVSPAIVQVPNLNESNVELVEDHEEPLT